MPGPELRGLLPLRGVGDVGSESSRAGQAVDRPRGSEERGGTVAARPVGGLSRWEQPRGVVGPPGCPGGAERVRLVLGRIGSSAGGTGSRPEKPCSGQVWEGSGHRSSIGSPENSNTFSDGHWLGACGDRVTDVARSRPGGVAAVGKARAKKPRTNSRKSSSS